MAGSGNLLQIRYHIQPLAGLSYPLGDSSLSAYLWIFPLCFIFSTLLLLILKHRLPAGFLSAGFNPRSNHSVPARQIGGLSCIPVFIFALIIFGLSEMLPARMSISLIIAATLVWVTGYLDDQKELSVRARLPLQLLAAMFAVYSLGADFRLLSELLPYWLEMLLLTIAILGSINVANFMDGLDWLTVTGIGIPLFLLGILSAIFLQEPAIPAISLAMAGALAGFAVFNRPPASIFLGDSGSLPLGLITGAVFLLFAGQAGIIPALILPLYYILDAGSTIILRLSKGENILQAHSSHAYQIAKRSGKSVYFVTGSLAILNLILGIITAAVLWSGTFMGQLSGLISAIVLTTLLILFFRKTV